MGREKRRRVEEPSLESVAQVITCICAYIHKYIYIIYIFHESVCVCVFVRVDSPGCFCVPIAKRK